MTPPDELSNLWQSIPPQPADLQALLREVERRASSFDRTIRRRDWRESIAGFAVAVLFTWLGLRARTPLGRVADFWLAAYGLWVVFYLWRNSGPGEAAPDGTLAEYRRRVIERYERQIRLLRQAKYWYILPLWIGGMLSAYAAFAQTRSFVLLITQASAFTATGLLLWWVNQAKGVPYVQNKQRDIMEFFGSERES